MLYAPGMTHIRRGLSMPDRWICHIPDWRVTLDGDPCIRAGWQHEEHEQYDDACEHDAANALYAEHADDAVLHDACLHAHGSSETMEVILLQKVLTVGHSVPCCSCFYHFDLDPRFWCVVLLVPVCGMCPCCTNRSTSCPAASVEHLNKSAKKWGWVESPQIVCFSLLLWLDFSQHIIIFPSFISHDSHPRQWWRAMASSFIHSMWLVVCRFYGELTLVRPNRILNSKVIHSFSFISLLSLRLQINSLWDLLYMTQHPLERGWGTLT